MHFEDVSQNENFDREKFNVSIVVQCHKKRKCNESDSGEEKVCCCSEGDLSCILYSLDKKPQDLKSILRTTRKYDEIACDENKDANLCIPIPRVKFSPDLITEVIYREKVTLSDRSMLFYSIREERKFAKEITLERQTATKLGLTWNEWINQNVE